MSIAEIMACLFFDEMRYNIKDPFDWANDELVLSKGHAAPILWAAYAEAGIFPVSSLKNLRKITSVSGRASYAADEMGESGDRISGTRIVCWCGHGGRDEAGQIAPQDLCDFGGWRDR